MPRRKQPDFSEVAAPSRYHFLRAGQALAKVNYGDVKNNLGLESPLHSGRPRSGAQPQLPPKDRPLQCGSLAQPPEEAGIKSKQGPLQDRGSASAALSWGEGRRTTGSVLSKPLAGD